MSNKISDFLVAKVSACSARRQRAGTCVCALGTLACCSVQEPSVHNSFSNSGLLLRHRLPDTPTCQG